MSCLHPVYVKRKKLKVTLVLTTFAYLRYFESLVRELADAGHEITLVTTIRNSFREEGLMDLIAPYIAQGKLQLVEEKRLKRHINSRVIFRNLAGYVNYFRREHPSPWMSKRFLTHETTPAYVRSMFKGYLMRKLFTLGRFRKLFESVDGLTPPLSAVKKWLSLTRPDVLISSAHVFFDSWDVEYVKAAKSLGIPTAVSVPSWDNLLIKGTFTIFPDRVLLWNSSLSEEAQRVHDVPAESIRITGAPVFDYLFDFKPGMDKRTFQESLGIPPGARYLLYLGSSGGIAENETGDVLCLVEALRKNPSTCDVFLLIRPHPYHSRIWRGLEADNVRIWPNGSDMPISDRSRLDFFHSIFFCDGVVGINTSAMLEAAILDKPCVTIMSSHGRGDITGVGHFHHLLDADFLYVSHDFQEASGQIQMLLLGRDEKSENRKRFVRDFIRPDGLDRCAGALIVRELEEFVRERQNGRIPENG
jgi:hypothetical protein